MSRMQTDDLIDTAGEILEHLKLLRRDGESYHLRKPDNERLAELLGEALVIVSSE